MIRSLLFVLALTFIACGGDDDHVALDAGADAGRRDAGPPVVLQVFTYTPDGCDYEVSTPEVQDPGLGDEVIGEGAPDHVHTSFAGPSWSSFAVNWRTDRETLASALLYGTDEDAVRAAEGPGEGVASQRGHTFLVASAFDPTGTRLHEVHVCALEPSTTYYYKVGGPGRWSEVYDYATAPALGTTEAWSFAITGDARNNRDNAWPLSQRRIMNRGVDLQIFSGDAVFLGALQRDWELFFGARADDFEVTELLARVAFMPTNGNHEGLAVNYLAQFALPQEVSPGERGQGEEWYSFDFGNAHFVVLNDTVLDQDVIAGAQGTWLREDLAAVDRERTPWIFAMHHRPFYTCESNHRPDLGLRAAWQPIFDEHEVDVVFNGHNHVYERSRPIRGVDGGEPRLAAEGPDAVPVMTRAGEGSGGPSGTLYVVAAAVGAPLYDASAACEFTHVATSETNYGVVEIEDRTLTITIRNVMTDALIDTFSYSK
ncbi:MAG: fibronectin type III domain-containing protein [Myxococcales bacterium]|nr:fibronectin type III domain-containing protein [Myxococcales bacterium]